MLEGSLLNSHHILLLSLELDLLEILQSRSQLSQVRSQLAILLRELIDLFPEQVHLIDSSSVSIRDVEEHLDTMVLLVQEVDLILQLLHCSLVGLMLVLLCQLVHVLAALIEFAQTHDFIVSDLDLLA